MQCKHAYTRSARSAGCAFDFKGIVRSYKTIFEERPVRWKMKAMTFWGKIRKRKMMNCKEVVDLLTEYLANALSQKDADGIQMHLAGCPKCTAFLDSLKTTVQWTRSLEPEDIPPEVVERLQAFLRSKTPPAR
jgi:hypothetical protein